jgi:hypothetical protein
MVKKVVDRPMVLSRRALTGSVVLANPQSVRRETQSHEDHLKSLPDPCNPSPVPT